MRGRTRVHIPIDVGLLQGHRVENICQGGLVPGGCWVASGTIGAIGVGLCSSKMCLCDLVQQPKTVTADEAAAGMS